MITNMTKINIFLFVLLFSAFHTKAQNVKLLIGKWQFKDFYNIAVTDTTETVKAQTAYRNLTMVFEPDCHYKANLLLGEEHGVWKYDESLKHLSMTNINRTEDSFTVIKLTNKELILIFDDKKGFVLEKQL
jgi:hypothetical protein